MKSWPEDGRPVDFDDLVDPLLSAIKQAYNVRRKVLVKSVNYDGYNIGIEERASGLQPDDVFLEESVTRLEQDGRSLLDAIMVLAVQLGIQQGRRLERAKIASRLKMYRKAKEEDKPALARIILDILDD